MNKEHRNQQDDFKLDEYKRGLSRREFLTAGAATGIITLAGFDIAGCSSSTPAVSSETTLTGTDKDDILALDPVGEPAETIQADIVIVGAGGSGLAAAIQAAQMGLNTVVVEKMGATGGSIVCTEGIFIIDNKYQNEIGIGYNREDIIASQMDYSHYITNPAILRTYYEQINETVDWLEDLGMSFSGLLNMGKFENTVLVWEHDPANTGLPGKLVGDSLSTAAENLGVEVLLDTPAKKILIEDDKAVGILAEKSDGSIIRIAAPVVIVATGGFSQNNELLAEYSGFVASPYTVGMLGRDGDGLKMGVDAGAKRWVYPGTSISSGPVLIGADWASLPLMFSRMPFLWINQDCERFIREDLTNTNFTYSGNACKMQKRVLEVFTQKDLDYHENTGPYSRVFSLIFEGTPMTGLTDMLMQIQENDGSIYVGETLDELASLANLDSAKLKRCIERYNSLCEEGEDKDFGKDPKYLYPIERGPYYAMECAVSISATCGSLYVSADCECLNNDLNPIHGLYAVGVDAGGLFADSYDASLAPCAMAGWALNSGRLAVKSAAGYLGKA
ncbi:MAG: FAD-binding protein [Coriobacteriales bacterium]|jgi:fumarate reductase flavoprotein subunit|nr:FAD-binding protein [Coriobacteriales bacterium]